MSVQGYPPVVSPDGDGYLNVVLDELFLRSGLKYKLVKSPARRGLADADDGSLDAVITPIPDHSLNFPSLLVVPEPILPLRFGGLYIRDDIVVARPEDFFNYRVAYLRGWIQAERLLHGHERSEQLRDAVLMMNMLALDRVDVVFFAIDAGHYIADQIGLKNLKDSEYIVRRIYVCI